jgi:hypothetical protein
MTLLPFTAIEDQHLKCNAKLPISLIEIVNRPDRFSDCVLNPSCLTLIGVR